MIILGIETTCDETGVAIVEDGRKVLSNVVSSSVELHKKYKGIVPEVAAREQVRVIIPVLRETIFNFKPNDIDAIAVSVGPGLVGSLLVGVETAKTLSVVWSKPLVPVNHLMGHIYANWLMQNSKLPEFPLVALIVSGGHTDLLLMIDHNQIKWLGGTLDDAAGEAFDKVARFLGLPYPGGPEIEKLATSCQRLKTKFQFPRPMIGSNNFDFSFSGLKTAVVNYARQMSDFKIQLSTIAHEFQNAVVEVIVTKTIKAARKFGAKSIVVGGGVAANKLLRSQLTVHGSQLGIPVRFPTIEYCIDNGAMIAAGAYFNFKPVSPEKIQAKPNLYFS